MDKEVQKYLQLGKLLEVFGILYLQSHLNMMTFK